MSTITGLLNRFYLGTTLLFIIWGLWVWWLSVIGLIAALLIYRYSILNSAKIYGDLIESAFDVYRNDLYKALRWPLPVNAEEEDTMGRKLTQYLWRGEDETMPTFIEQSAKHDSNTQHNSRQQSKPGKSKTD